MRYRVRDAIKYNITVYEVVDDTRDVAIAQCYHSEEAKLIVKAMNKAYNKEEHNETKTL